jgi:hypothetical protein
LASIKIQIQRENKLKQIIKWNKTNSKS